MKKPPSTSPALDAALLAHIRGFDLASAPGDAARAEAMRLVLAGDGDGGDDLVMDMSRQPVDDEILKALVAFAEARGIPATRDAMLRGDVVNESEGRAATHCMLRDMSTSAAQKNLAVMVAQCAHLRALGLRDVVAIGIGGSELGPRMAGAALAPYHLRRDDKAAPRVHFIGNIDPAALDDCLADCDPAATGFIAVSKSFRTEETLANLAAARQWLAAGGIASADMESRLLAVTADSGEAARHGFSDARILLMDGSIGGRFSLWSAAGLGLMLTIGEAHFRRMLAGAHAMDRHFATAPPAANMPVRAALLRFMHTHCLGRGAEAVIPYDERLGQGGFVAWLQQLEMESNGKPFNGEPFNGKSAPANPLTAPVIFGGAGSSAQHSLFQMLHQGAQIVPVDFCAPAMPHGDGDDAHARHRALLVNMTAQADALARGGRPSTLYTWGRTTPYALGRLLALYEHATVVHGWLLGVNPFDQPGVESGKRLAARYHAWLAGDGDGGGDGGGDGEIPPATARLLQRYRGA